MTLDTLSQLLNRREFYLQSLQKYKEAQEDGGAIIFIMLDIDHFKRINDTYGHDCGDKVIKSVSDILLGQTRDGDIVGRLGGEEFGVVLPFTAVNDAVSIAEQIRKTVESNRIEFEGHIISVTISIGVAQKQTRQAILAH
jgi:diguanylate cyclase